jgi:hypothetical protein
MFLYTVFSNTSYPGIAWAATAAAFASMLTIAAVGYRPTSLVAIFGLMTMLSYPGAAFMNLLLEEPAVRWDLWQEADLAMWGSVVGSLAMAAGAWLTKLKLVNSRPSIPTKVIDVSTSRGFNVTLASVLIVVVAAKVGLGVYYHSSVSEYDFESKGYLNLLNYLALISYCGIFLQLRRYLTTKSRVDAILALVLALAPVIAFLPSGSRQSALGHVPLLLLAYMAWGRQAREKLVVLTAGTAVLLFLLVVIGIYRDIAGASTSNLTGQTEIIAEVAQHAGADDAEAGAALIIGRVSDFVATGRIISATPDLFPFRLFDGMEDWWQIAIPGFLRPRNGELNFVEGAVTTYMYGVSPGAWSSTPVMAVGDLFSRFGWIGVLFGMGLLGFALRKIDSRFITGKGIYGVLFFALFAGLTWQLYTASLLIVFVALTRDLLIVYLLSRGLGWIAFRFTKRPARNGTANIRREYLIKAPR